MSIPRIQYLAIGAMLTGVLLLSAACSSERKVPTPTPSPVPSAPPLTAAPPASPTAAGASGTPLVPASRTPGPAGAGEAEAQVRRVVLLPTDVPGGAVVIAPETFTAEAMAANAVDPAGYRERTTRFGRLAGSRASIGGSGSAGAGATAMRYATVEGAHGDLAERERAGLRLSADERFIVPPLDVPIGVPPALVLTPPPAGERALRWVWTPEGAVAPVTTIAFQRGTMLVVVTATGGADAEALARILDTRAQAAQR